MSYGPRTKMARSSVAGLEYLPRKMKLEGDGRRMVAMCATDAVPDGLDGGHVLAAWFKSGWSESTVVSRSVRLVEARQKTGCGLVFVGVHRRNVPKELSDAVDAFVN